MKHILVFILAFAIGIGAGYGLFHEDRDEIRIAAPAAIAETPGSEREPAAGSSTRAEAAKKDAGAGDVEEILRRTVPREDYLSCVNEKHRLKARLQKTLDRLNLDHNQAETLEKELSWAQHDIASVTGAPVEWPENIDEGFLQAPMMKAMGVALEEKGLKGSISEVDCSEFPCILVGSIEGEHEYPILKELLETDAMGHIRDGSASSNSTTKWETGPDGKRSPVFHFCVGYISQDVFPENKDKGLFANLPKRTMYRVRQICEAVIKE